MPNRLASEKSPYLLQHAANPVDWYPWGDEAFEAARREDKPIFLSIGYSTCHWCHVMEHESFEDPAIARLLNSRFVPIKVDREERPDVDRVYMLFVQATTGSGGWPMSVWLTPELQALLRRHVLPAGRPVRAAGLRGGPRGDQPRLAGEPRRRAAIGSEADGAAPRLRERGAETLGPSVPGPEALAAAVREFEAAFDAGAEDSAARRSSRGRRSCSSCCASTRGRAASRARDMVLQTLRAMAAGGMRDHVGGGFHRYSVDADWRVPHFEKMLYDQAQLSLAYLEAHQVTGDPCYADVADDTLRYVSREMTDPRGGFYSAEDADSLPPENRSATRGAHV